MSSDSKKELKKILYLVVLAITLVYVIAGILMPDRLEGSADFLKRAVLYALPIFLGGIGIVYSERAGMVNLGAEGMMLNGAFATWVVGATTNNWFAAIVAGMIAGLLTGLIFAFFSITLRSSQIVVGVAINIFALGLTTTLQTAVKEKSPDFANLSNLPVVPIGSKLSQLFGNSDNQFLIKSFDLNILVYIGIALVFLSGYILFKTDAGLKVRAVGEHPKACDTVGINVYVVRYISALIGGIFCGLGGAFVLMNVSDFSYNMTSGRGFLVLAAVLFGRYNPKGMLGATIVFGLSYSLTFVFKIPPEFGNAFPFAVTIIILAILGNSRRPAASTQPYVKE